jgi:tRNA uridine 5-carboxymethylaminomethyl modification enzyme
MNSALEKFDVIVVGAGHAGIEAAHAAAKMGSQTLLITLEKDKIGWMPCNPAVGGIGKGHIVYEISALGGLMPRLCTQSYLQARMLNTKKGPAVQGLRLQIDKYRYNTLSKDYLMSMPNLTIHEGTAHTILTDDASHVTGVTTEDGISFHAPTVILTTGTFLKGKIFIGQETYDAGRVGEKAVVGLSAFLNKAGLKLGRLKTGTPPRLLKSSVNFDVLETQGTEKLTSLFEFPPHDVVQTRECHIARTTPETHQIIRDNLHLSAMYNGNISGIGPRYCPSIEDKIGRFPDKESHQIFVEPEGLDADELYPNGISTSLPREVQKAYIQSIKGFENAVITKPGYAVEYDFVLPNQLHHTLELKSVPGLFLAGQINGTTGYEEAAGQGLVAGINAHQKAHAKEPVILERTQSYIGVMIDDLVTMGVDEPYRMFTSRAEHRLLLRQDNAFLRLMPLGYQLGLIDEALYQDFLTEKEAIEKAIEHIKANYVVTPFIDLFGTTDSDAALILEKAGITLSERAAQTVHAQLRYGPYFAREEQEIKRREQHQTMRLPAELIIENMPGLSKELQQKIKRHQPATIAAAALIPGMTPAALSLLIFKVRELERIKDKKQKNKEQ